MGAYLTPWRWAAALGSLLVVGAPLLLPLAQLAIQGSGVWTADDWLRLAGLFQQTFLLVSGTLALALPIGIALAILLFRTEFPGRQFLLGATFIMLFVPLPMITSAWQAFFGNDGWLHLALWGENVGRPWTTGIVPAIWVQFLAGLPWVVFFVGLGLTWVERELEEEGLLIGPPWWVLLRITLPRCRGAIVFAAIWLALQTAGEIGVTDMMLVSTFAEEVQTQFTTSGRAAVARSVFTALPLVLATWGFLAYYLPRLERDLPPLQLRLAEPRRFSWGRWRWPIGFGGTAAILLMFGVPLLSLLWKLGQSGFPPHWSALNGWSHFLKSLRSTDSGAVWKSVLVAGGVGASISLFALLLCWLGDECPWFRRLLIVVLALAWALPGPIIGIGLKDTIQTIVERWPDSWLARALYYRSSPLPLAWADLVRFLPFAVALLWPVVRLVPREPREAARLEGHGPWQELWTVTWPLTRRSVFWCAVLVAALCLGEVAAAARVETPGWESYTKLLFDRMHNGVENSVAALSLLLLAAIVILATIFLIIMRCLPFRARSEAPHQ
jgi:iron(III) transport system permease protein